MNQSSKLSLALALGATLASGCTLVADFPADLLVDASIPDADTGIPETGVPDADTGIPDGSVTCSMEDPCMNGGTCSDTDGGRACDCTDTGFMGSTCETNVDDCAAADLGNGNPCDG